MENGVSVLFNTHQEQGVLSQCHQRTPSQWPSAWCDPISVHVINTQGSNGVRVRYAKWTL